MVGSLFGFRFRFWWVYCDEIQNLELDWQVCVFEVIFCYWAGLYGLLKFLVLICIVLWIIGLGDF
jgi:hypothetical protein